MTVHVVTRGDDDEEVIAWRRERARVGTWVLGDDGRLRLVKPVPSPLVAALAQAVLDQHAKRVGKP